MACTEDWTGDMGEKTEGPASAGFCRSWSNYINSTLSGGKFSHADKAQQTKTQERQSAGFWYCCCFKLQVVQRAEITDDFEVLDVINATAVDAGINIRSDRY
jgi:hypothetical protein